MTKKYHVEISDRAEKDIDTNHSYIARDKPGAADRWADKIFKLIKSLKTNPHRFEEIPEGGAFDHSYRHVLHGPYRIIYRIEEETVRVLRIFHAARLLLPNHLEE